MKKAECTLSVYNRNVHIHLQIDIGLAYDKLFVRDLSNMSHICLYNMERALKPNYS